MPIIYSVMKEQVKLDAFYEIQQVDESETESSYQEGKDPDAFTLAKTDYYDNVIGETIAGYGEEGTLYQLEAHEYDGDEHVETSVLESVVIR